MYKIVVFIPGDALAQVKEAMFAEGAGQMGNYAQCAWQSKGQGQFRPSDVASPAIGHANELSVVVEFRVEMVCPRDCISEVVEAIHRAHPYETPAFDIIKLEELC